MDGLRTPETAAVYEQIKASEAFAKNCGCCEERETVRDFTYWRIVSNLYPYDRIARVHHMLTSKRHTSDEQLTAEEKEELESIRAGVYVQETYDIMIEATRSRKSIPDHAHLHLVVLKT